MNLKEQTLNFAQMEHLRKLGFDTTDASLVLIYKDDDGNEVSPSDLSEGECGMIYLNDDGEQCEVGGMYCDALAGDYDHSFREECAVYTLADVISKLPLSIHLPFGDYVIDTTKVPQRMLSYKCADLEMELCSVEGISTLDLAYKMLCELKEHYLIEG